MEDKRNEAQEVCEAYRSILVGNVYKHFKGNKYIVLQVGIHSETAEIMVIYASVEEPKNIWIRPVEMFMSPVDKKKYPDVKQVMRFEFVGQKVDSENE